MKGSCVWLVVIVGADNFHVECGSLGGYHIHIYIYPYCGTLNYVPYQQPGVVPCNAPPAEALRDRLCSGTGSDEGGLTMSPPHRPTVPRC